MIEIVGKVGILWIVKKSNIVNGISILKLILKFCFNKLMILLIWFVFVELFVLNFIKIKIINVIIKFGIVV